MVFVIAECGVNWRNLSEADEMIKAAAAAGADAAKFQCYKPNFHPPVNVGVFTERKIGTIHAEHLNRIALTEPDIRYLYWRCQQHGIEFMCTPMYPEAVAMLNPYVERWKVRYADRENESILSPCRATGKPMLVSGKNIWCCPEYPPGIPNYPCGILIPLKEPTTIGVSCHFPVVLRTIDPTIEYLEVHVRLDRYDPAWDPIDQRVSITMSELRQLCKELGK